MNFYLIDIFPDIHSDRKQLMFQTSIRKNVAVYYHNSSTSIVNTISEFRVNSDGSIEFIKVRTDKTAELNTGTQYGNNIRTAESIYFNALNPLTLQKMRDTEVEYFVNKKTRKHAAIKANNKVKDMLFETYIKRLGSCRLVDMCCGKGQDMKRCFDSKVTTLIGIDSSLDALEEMNERKYFIVRNSPMKVVLVHADLNKETVNIEEKGDVILINFAIHYLVHNTETLNRLIDQLDLLGDKKYTVIITCFDGKSVLDSLDENGEFKREKYYIKKQTTKSSRGEMPVIEVLHHFSNEPIPEYLLDSEWMINGFKSKFNLVSTRLFDTKDVEGEDKEYHNLYRYYVFTRK
jgi:hypothetical protein